MNELPTWLEQTIADACPSNWLDALLTGPSAVIGTPPYGCPDIERLIASIRRRLLTDLRAAWQAQEEGWQPISTAPKDGRWIWLATKFTVSPFKWDAKHSREGMWFAGTGWWHQIDNLFTHWMPMSASAPAPPAAAEPPKEKP